MPEFSKALGTPKYCWAFYDLFKAF